MTKLERLLRAALDLAALSEEAADLRTAVRVLNQQLEDERQKVRQLRQQVRRASRAR